MYFGAGPDWKNSSIEFSQVWYFSALFPIPQETRYSIWVWHLVKHRCFKKSQYRILQTCFGDQTQPPSYRSPLEKWGNYLNQSSEKVHLCFDSLANSGKSKIFIWMISVIGLLLCFTSESLTKAEAAPYRQGGADSRELVHRKRLWEGALAETLWRNFNKGSS